MEKHNMDNQDANLPGADSPVSDQSGRRDFIKKMVIAGAFAAPVVATFARGARGSSTLRAELADNAGAPAVNSFEAQLLNSRGQAHFQNAANTTSVPSPATTRAPIVTSNVTTAPATAAPTTAAPTTAAPTTSAPVCSTRTPTRAWNGGRAAGS